ncbi:MAG TPA: helix-turn-helix domain-containing protein [Ktedonobacterales bacterium]|nr:helix-turn-helix domain-containing protein [Ktedonobacterales bacterium]
MQDMLYIEEVEQAAVLLKPRRLEILKRLAEPRSCLELAEALEDTPQKIYYHVKALEQAGLVEKVSERRVRGILEGFYQARARSYWLAPSLVGQIGARRSQEQASLSFLLGLAEQLQTEVGHLAQTPSAEVPSVGLTAQIELRDPQQRSAFMRDLQQNIQALARKYGRQEGEPEAGQIFRLLLACYPAPASPTEASPDRRDH